MRFTRYTIHAKVFGTTPSPVSSPAPMRPRSGWIRPSWACRGDGPTERRVFRPRPRRAPLLSAGVLTRVWVDRVTSPPPAGRRGACGQSWRGSQPGPGLGRPCVRGPGHQSLPAGGAGDAAAAGAPPGGGGQQPAAGARPEGGPRAGGAARPARGASAAVPAGAGADLPGQGAARPGARGSPAAGPARPGPDAPPVPRSWTAPG